VHQGINCAFQKGTVDKMGENLWEEVMNTPIQRLQHLHQEINE
jgi:hypothetical protein